MKTDPNAEPEVNILRQENEKLRAEIEDLRNANSYLKNLNDMLVTEVKDYESTQEKLILQVLGPTIYTALLFTSVIGEVT